MDYDNFFISKIKTYMLWNRIDPPDDDEKRRNDLVYKYQGNRNPFIDNPELIEKIGELPGV
jgi:endonuclease I